MPILDRILETVRPALAQDFQAYRGHAYRVANYCLFLTGATGPDVEKISIAAACHDVGIWVNATFDYLEPSRKFLAAWLAQTERSEWLPELSAMVGMHHKVAPYSGDHARLAEAFRQSDWLDLTAGLRSGGLPPSFLQETRTCFPEHGFRSLLLRLFLKNLAAHPLNPLPMFRL